MSGYRERKGGREREKDTSTDRSGGERKIVAQTGVGEREGGRETGWGRERNTGWERER